MIFLQFTTKKCKGNGEMKKIFTVSGVPWKKIRESESCERK